MCWFVWVPLPLSTSESTGTSAAGKTRSSIGSLAVELYHGRAGPRRSKNVEKQRSLSDSYVGFTSMS